MLTLLSGKLSLSEVKEIARWGNLSESNIEVLWKWSSSEDRRMAVNSLWVLTHMNPDCLDGLERFQSELINRLLLEDDGTKKRIYLQLLREQKLIADEESIIRLYDYCLSKINSEYEPYAIRCFSMYVAGSICERFPELLSEFQQRLELLELQSLSPGLKSGLRQTKVRVKKIKSRLNHL